MKRTHFDTFDPLNQTLEDTLDQLWGRIGSPQDVFDVGVTLKAIDNAEDILILMSGQGRFKSSSLAASGEPGWAYLFTRHSHIDEFKDKNDLDGNVRHRYGFKTFLERKNNGNTPPNVQRYVDAGFRTSYLNSFFIGERTGYSAQFNVDLEKDILLDPMEFVHLDSYEELDTVVVEESPAQRGMDYFAELPPATLRRRYQSLDELEDYENLVAAAEAVLIGIQDHFDHRTCHALADHNEAYLEEINDHQAYHIPLRSLFEITDPDLYDWFLEQWRQQREALEHDINMSVVDNSGDAIKLRRLYDTLEALAEAHKHPLIINRTFTYGGDVRDPRTFKPYHSDDAPNRSLLQFTAPLALRLFELADKHDVRVIFSWANADTDRFEYWADRYQMRETRAYTIEHMDPDQWRETLRDEENTGRCPDITFFDAGDYVDRGTLMTEVTHIDRRTNQDPGGSLSRGRLRKHWDQIEPALEYLDARDATFILPKQLRGHDTDLFTTDNSAHFGDIEGSNKFRETDVLAVVSDQIPSAPQLVKSVMERHGRMPDSTTLIDGETVVPEDARRVNDHGSLTGYDDELLDQQYQWIVRDTKHDAAMRMRGQRDSVKELYIFNLLPDGLADQYDAIKHAALTDFLDLEAQRHLTDGVEATDAHRILADHADHSFEEKDDRLWKTGTSLTRDELSDRIRHLLEQDQPRSFRSLTREQFPSTDRFLAAQDDTIREVRDEDERVTKTDDGWELT